MPDTTSSLSLALRGLAVAALGLGAVRAWRRGGMSAGERRGLAILTAVVLALVAGVLVYATLADRAT